MLADHEGQHGGEDVKGDEAGAVGRVGHQADDNLFRAPTLHEHHLVEDGVGAVAPAAIELAVVPGNVAAPHHLERLVVEAAEVAPDVEQGRRDGRQRDEEIGAKIYTEAVNQAHDAAQAHGLLHVQVQPVQSPLAHHVPQGAVVALKDGVVVAVERLLAKGASGGAAEHAQDLDAGGLEGGDLAPESVEARVGGDMVVEGDDLGRVGLLVDVKSGEVEVGETDGWAALDQGEDADGLAVERTVSMVMRLIVDDDAGEARRWNRCHPFRRRGRGRGRGGWDGQRQDEALDDKPRIDKKQCLIHENQSPFLYQRDEKGRQVVPHSVCRGGA